MPGVLYIDTWQVLLMPGVLIYTWQVLLMVIVIYGMQFLRHKSSYTYGKYQSRQVLLTGTARVLLTGTSRVLLTGTARVLLTAGISLTWYALLHSAGDLFQKLTSNNEKRKCKKIF